MNNRQREVNMKIAVGADERNNVVDAIIEHLRQEGHEVTWFGPVGSGSVTWPEAAFQVAREIALHRVDEGILFCWTGTGVSIAANKVPGIRAALCVDAETARGARLWNDANCLCISLRLTSEPVALEIIKAWLTTPYQPNPEDDACLEKIRQVEEEGFEDIYGP